MGRQPKIRVSYHNDAQWLLRLIGAVKKDEARPKEWRTKVISQLQSLATDFLQAPEPNK